MDLPFSACNGDEPYVFVSYSHSNTPIVFPELEWLRGCGFNIWYDEGIEPGAEWREELAKAIEGAKLLIYFVTGDSVRSENCRKEVNFAVSEHVPIVAIHLEAVELPAGLRLTLADRQAIFKYEIPIAGYQQKLQSSISAYLEPPVDRSDLEARKNTLPEGASIAVLPFVNMSSDQEQEYFSDGISEEILNVLSQIPSLHVTSRSSSFAYKGKEINLPEVARILGVSNILEGSVRKSGDRIRITAQLITAGSDKHLWSKSFDRTLTVSNIFDIQDEIAGAIVTSLKRELGLDVFDVRVAPRKKTSSMEAYDAYLLASYQFTRLQFKKAQLSLERVISLDPDFEKAYAFLVSFHTSRIWYGLTSWEKELPTIQRYVDKTLALNPENKHVLSVLAIIRFYYYHDFQDALDIVARSTSGMDNLAWYPMILQTLGQLEMAVKIREHQARSDPLNPDAQRLHAMFLNYVGRSDDALRALEKAEQLGLKDPAILAQIAIKRGDYKVLESQLDSLMEKFGEKQGYYLYFKAWFHFLSGNHAMASEVYAPVRESPDDYQFIDKAWAAYFQQEKKLFIDYFAKALEANETLAWGGMNEIPGEIKKHPDFNEMLKKFKLDRNSIEKLDFPKLPI